MVGQQWSIDETIQRIIRFSDKVADACDLLLWNSNNQLCETCKKLAKVFEDCLCICVQVE